MSIFKDYYLNDFQKLAVEKFLKVKIGD